MGMVLKPMIIFRSFEELVGGVFWDIQDTTLLDKSGCKIILSSKIDALKTQINDF